MPEPGPGTCAVCHGPSGSRFDICFCCRRLAHQLGRPLAPVVPVSVVAVPSPLHAALRGYKDGAVAEARHRFASLVASLLDGFVARHGGCLERMMEGPVDLVVPIPPTRRRGEAPVARLGAGHWATRVRPALVRGPGPLGHLRASRHGFSLAAGPAVSELPGCRAVLLDDVLTTGARAQSAAATLADAGADAVAVLVVGRAVRPARSTAQAAYWRRVAAAGFSPGRCCVPGCPGAEGGAGRS